MFCNFNENPWAMVSLQRKLRNCSVANFIYFQFECFHYGPPPTTEESNSGEMQQYTKS